MRQGPRCPEWLLVRAPCMDRLPPLPCVTFPSVIPASWDHFPDTLLARIPETQGLSLGGTETKTVISPRPPTDEEK